ncbi:VOC family protein [Larkinella sp.]|uniref:VOC family protein n=1 Tax=Larkinella sp. TaxID=2034517 RepID=UPI003BADBCC3
MEINHFITAIDHIQLSMLPNGQEDIRNFYVTILGMEEVFNPGSTGGVWLKSGSIHIHFGVDPQLIPSKYAHIALRINNLPSFLERCHHFSIDIEKRDAVDVTHRIYIKDPFGNKIELINTK